MRSIPLIYALIFLALTSFTSCLQPEKPVTAEEAKALAQTIERDMDRRNPASFEAAFDIESLKDRMKKYAGKRASGRLINATANDLKKTGLGIQIAQSLGKDGHYHLVKQYEKDGHQHLVFRLYAGQAINYHDLELVKRMGRVKIADGLIYLSGENFSATLTEAAVLLNQEYDNLSADERDRVGNLKMIRQLINEKKFAEANQLYQALPASLRQQKVFQAFSIDIAAGLDDESYAKALEEFVRLYPDAPNIPLLMIDRYIMSKEYEKAMEAVNRLDAMINKDPLLDYYRALISSMLGDMKQKGVYLERLYKAMPDYGDGIVELVAFYMDNGEEEKASAIYKYQQGRNALTADNRETLEMLFPSLDEEATAN